MTVPMSTLWMCFRLAIMYLYFHLLNHCHIYSSSLEAPRAKKYYQIRNKRIFEESTFQPCSQFRIDKFCLFRPKCSSKKETPGSAPTGLWRPGLRTDVSNGRATGSRRLLSLSIWEKIGQSLIRWRKSLLLLTVPQLWCFCLCKYRQRYQTPASEMELQWDMLW